MAGISESAPNPRNPLPSTEPHQVTSTVAPPSLHRATGQWALPHTQTRKRPGRAGPDRGLATHWQPLLEPPTHTLMVPVTQKTQHSLPSCHRSAWLSRTGQDPSWPSMAFNAAGLRCRWGHGLGTPQCLPDLSCEPGTHTRPLGHAHSRPWSCQVRTQSGGHRMSQGCGCVGVRRARWVPVGLLTLQQTGGSPWLLSEAAGSVSAEGGCVGKGEGEGGQVGGEKGLTRSPAHPHWQSSPGSWLRDDHSTVSLLGQWEIKMR